MILINLLPPELRKSTNGVLNPVMMSAGVGGLLCALLLGFWMYVKFVSLKHANDVLDAQTLVLATKSAEAQEVIDKEASIAGFQEHRDGIVGLLAKKVYWAHTLDDFANHLAGHWPGFVVCVTELSVTPTAGSESRMEKEKAERVLYSITGKYRLIGDERDKAGNYIKDFLDGTEASSFWKQNQFIAKPESSYKGDAPSWVSDIKRVVIDLPCDWQRAKLLPVTKNVVN